MSGAEGQNVVALLEHLSRAAPTRPALVEPGGAQVGFAELEARVARLAGGLRAAGAQRGDRFLVLQPMSIPLYVSLLALFRAELTAVLLDPAAPRLDAVLRRLSLQGFIGSPRAQLLRLLRPALRGLPRYVSSGRGLLPSLQLDALDGPAPAPAPVPPELHALLTFTTGSTGTPKPLARTHGFLLAQHRILVEHMGLGPGDVDLPTLPVFLLNSLAAGATCVLPDADLRAVGRVQPERIIRQLVRHGCTTTSGSPAFLGPIARALRDAGRQLPQLRSVFTGGAPVPPALLADLVRVAPQARVEVLYGSSEAEPIASISAREVLEDTAHQEAAGRGRCVGRPVPGIEVRICALGGGAVPLPEGTVGEILVSGPHVSASYFESPEADARHKVHAEGRVWHRTGDTGYLDRRRSPLACGKGGPGRRRTTPAPRGGGGRDPSLREARRAGGGGGRGRPGLRGARAAGALAGAAARGVWRGPGGGPAPAAGGPAAQRQGGPAEGACTALSPRPGHQPARIAPAAPRVRDDTARACAQLPRPTASGPTSRRPSPSTRRAGRSMRS